MFGLSQVDATQNHHTGAAKAFLAGLVARRLDDAQAGHLYSGTIYRNRPGP
jgi:hypothetical protein